MLIDGCGWAVSSVQRATDQIRALIVAVPSSPTAKPRATATATATATCSSPTHPHPLSPIITKKPRSSSTLHTHKQQEQQHQQQQLQQQGHSNDQQHPTNVRLSGAPTSTCLWGSSGHVVARLLWDLVAQHTTTFVLHVTVMPGTPPTLLAAAQSRSFGSYKSNCPPTVKELYLCVRVSPLLGSVVGRVEERYLAVPFFGEKEQCWWVHDGVFLEKREHGVPTCQWWLKDGRVSAHGGALGTQQEIRMVDRDPVGWYGLHEVINSKWLVRWGFLRGSVGSLRDTPEMLTIKLNVPSALQTTGCGSQLCGVTTVDSYFQRPFNYFKFSHSRPDELLAVVRRPMEVTPSFLVIDVDATHTSGTLKILSTTRCLDDIDSSYARMLFDVFAMSQKRGTLSFIVQVAAKCHQVDGQTGVSRELPHASYCPLSDSEYFPDGIIQGGGNVPVFDCNNSAKQAARFIQMPISPSRHPCLVKGSMGFLFHVDPAVPCITVVDASVAKPSTTAAVLVLSFPLWKILTLSVDFSSP